MLLKGRSFQTPGCYFLSGVIVSFYQFFDALRYHSLELLFLATSLNLDIEINHAHQSIADFRERMTLGETEGRNMQQITPDFIIDTNDDGTIIACAGPERQECQLWRGCLCLAAYLKRSPLFHVRHIVGG